MFCTASEFTTCTLDFGAASQNQLAMLHIVMCAVMLTALPVRPKLNLAVARTGGALHTAARLLGLPLSGTC
jgi:hypothetical protein